MGVRRRLVSGLRLAERGFDRLRFELKRRLGLLDPFEVLPYRGHGTARELFLRGRVLEERGITSSGQHDTVWDNVRNMVRRFASDEVSGAVVRASFDGAVVETTADEEGFFDVRLEPRGPLRGATAWHPVELELLRPGSPDGRRVRSTGRALVPTGASFGIISDLDDTVLRSDVTSVLRMLRIVLFNNAHTRLPFEGVAQFYRALQGGKDARESNNPVFYVSSSPWNIYDVLEDFLDVHGVPAGPLFLKDWGPGALKAAHAEHKLGIIRTLLRTYPGLPFVLIGDSGEQDPEIYREAVREHPGRVLAVYIRDVAGAERDAEVKGIAREVRDLGPEMVLVADTAAAAEHAAAAGLIAPDAVPKIRRESAATA